MGERLMPWTYNPFTDELDFYHTFSSSTNSTNYTGSDCEGTDGEANRTLATSGVTMVWVENQPLHPTIDYTISGNTITFLNNMWNFKGDGVTPTDITVWN